MIAATVSRVTSNTPEQINERIRQQTEENIARCAAGGLDAIRGRLAELDAEWDVERALEAIASGFTLVGLTMTVARGRRWLVLPSIVAGFLFQHALQGWCPPLPALRWLGFRTADEINQERYTLKALRGDFREVRVVETRPMPGASEAFEAAQR